MNCTVVLGNIGQEPSFRRTRSGVAVMNFSIAVDKTHGDRKTNWFDVVVWDSLAEAMNKYLQKGSRICIQGELNARSYLDEAGNNVSRVEIVASQIQFLGNIRSPELAIQSQQDPG